MPDERPRGAVTLEIDLLKVLEDAGRRTEGMFGELRDDIKGLADQVATSNRDARLYRDEQERRLNKLESSLALHEAAPGHMQGLGELHKLGARVEELAKGVVEAQAAVADAALAKGDRRWQIATLVATLSMLAALIAALVALAGHVSLH